MTERRAPHTRGTNGNGKPALFTIGYEGRSQDDLLKLLRLNGVSVLVDVRELPFSRRSGFSKTPLRELVVQHKISYYHDATLGSPRRLRHKARRDGDLNYFFSKFEEYLDGQEDSLRAVADLLKTDSICLICYEADHEFCHRHIVAERLRKIAKAKVIHL